MSKQSKINENTDKNIISIKEFESRLDYIIKSFSKNKNESINNFEKNRISDFKENNFNSFSENKNSDNLDLSSEKIENNNTEIENIEEKVNNSNKIQKEFLGIKRKFKKIKKIQSENQRKKQIKIILQEIDINEPETKKIQINNYEYLFSSFNDNIDDSIHITSNIKIILESKNIFENENQNGKFLSFGEEPCKIYKDSIYNALNYISNQKNKLEKNQNSFPCDIQKLISSIPIINFNSQEILSKIKNSQNYSISQNQLLKFKNETISKNNLKEFTPIKNSSFINTNSNSNSEIKYYDCSYCNCKFSSPQGLGGHMSRTHKCQSLKFLKKKEIRAKREPIRRSLELSKKAIYEKYYNKEKIRGEQIDYDTFIKSKKGKEKIKQLVNEHPKEFKKIRKELNDANLNQIE